MSDELETANAEVVLGIEVEKFLETPVGQYLMGCSNQDETEATNKLLNIDPYKSTTLAALQSDIAKLQQNVHIARKVQGYLGDAIIKGNQAEEIIINQEE